MYKRQVIDNALANGYPVSWGTDVSEKGFSRTKAIGIIPEADLANMDEMCIRDRARAGEEVTMRKATVNIYELELLE